jgi:DNA-binding winged helix-turn-helix (wHTH) protein/tetratricopeptide (TPR) repeat protein
MIYIFGAYELDTGLYQLRQMGQPLKVEPKVFDLLLYLVQRRDSVVSKDDLLEHLWPNQYISEATLSGCVMAARKAVGDSGQTQRTIQTVRGRGYRFVAAIEEHAGAAPSTTQLQEGVEAPSQTEPAQHDEFSARAASFPVSQKRPDWPAPDTWSCPACQQMNSVAAMFCVVCGTRLAQTCLHCALHVRLPATFCPACGQPLAGPPPSQAPEYPRSRFVGRERELALLSELLERAEGGRGQVVGVVGEPALGKSWLLNEFRRALQDRHVTYLEGHCQASGLALPYLPMLDILRQTLGLTAADSAATITMKAHRRLQELGLPPQEAAPYLLQLLGVQEGTQRLIGLSAETLRIQMFTTWCQMLLACSRQQPLVMAIEDLHWIDKASDDLLTSLIHRLAHAPILLVVTFCPEYHPTWLQQSYATQVLLPPLTPHDSLRLLQAVLPPERLSASLTQIILARASGNPLFLEELAQAVAEQRSLASDSAMPDTIRGVLMARLDHLPDEARQLLQTAAVLGRTFPLRLLEAIWQGPSGLDPLLLELERRALCYEQPGAPEPTYVFKHVLIQDVAHKSLLPARRQALHAAAAQALERLHVARLDEVCDLLASHYAQTEQTVKAVEYLTRFADQATRRCAHEAALAALQQALARVDSPPLEEQERRRLNLVLRQAHALFSLGRIQEAATLLRQQHARLEQLQDAWLTGRYALLLGQTSSRAGEWEQAAQYARQAVEAATSCHDDVTVGQAYYLLATEQYWIGQPLQGLAYGEQAVALLEQSAPSYTLGMAHFVLGLTCLLLGDFEPALEALTQARTIGDSLREPHLQAFAAWASGWMHATRGAWEAGIEACQRSLDTSPDPLNTAFALGWLGYAYLEKGDPGEALPLLQQAIAHMEHFQYQRLVGFYTILLGEAWLLHGDLEQASHFVRQGVELVRTAMYHMGIGWGQRALGKLALANGVFSEAEYHLLQALDTFVPLSARFEVARTYLALANVTYHRGQHGATTKHLTEAYNLFMALRVSVYVEHTEQRAHELGVSLAETGSTPPTSQQVEGTRLVRHELRGTCS